jgi:hypothetical protein
MATVSFTETAARSPKSSEAAVIIPSLDLKAPRKRYDR